MATNDGRQPTDARANQAQTREIQRQADAMARERRQLEREAGHQRPSEFAHPKPVYTDPRPTPSAREQARRPALHKPKRVAGRNDSFVANDPSTSHAPRRKRSKD